MNIQFSGVNLYQSKSRKGMDNFIEKKQDLSYLFLANGQRQVGAKHQLLELTGKDAFAFLESFYDIQIPDTLKTQPMDQAMETIMTKPEYQNIVKKIDAVLEANQDPSATYMDLTLPITLTTKLFEYLGFCLGRGADAEGNPVKSIDIDTPQNPPSA